MSQITILNGPERRRRWHEDDRVRILEAAFAPGAAIAEVARRFDVSTSLIVNSLPTTTPFWSAPLGVDSSRVLN